MTVPRGGAILAGGAAGVAVVCCAVPGGLAAGAAFGLGAVLAAHGAWVVATASGAVAMGFVVVLRRRRERCEACVRANPSIVRWLAAVSPTRLGEARGSRLDEAERPLYRWALGEMASGRRVDRAMLRRRATELGIDGDAALQRMADEDLLHVDERSGRVRSAYPLSGDPTHHEVKPDGDAVTLYAMCAVDALGIPFMLGRPAAIASRDPLTGVALHTHVRPDGHVSWQPRGMVVLLGAHRGSAPNEALACPVINFFESRASARRFLRERRTVRARLLSIPDAVAAGRAIFARALGD